MHVPDEPACAADATNSLGDSVGSSDQIRHAVESPAPTSTARYDLGLEIAHGGMGVVYRATDLTLSREVAVKVLHDKYGVGSGASRRFADEARITAQLQHPAIPPVHDLGTLPDGRPFLAMKLIKGDTLEDLLAARAEAAADRGRFIAVFEQVCHALAFAHSHDVIHRDLKPANIMVGSFGEVQVMDWGLAKVLGASPASASDPNETMAGTQIQSLRWSEEEYFTQAGSILGTPAFMPPEQAAGAVGQIDARSDVFGLGAILAVILTGKAPFVGSTAEETRIKAAQGRVEECLTRLDSCGADPGLVALCRRCLSPDPQDRPADADEVAKTVAELRAAADERARQAELDLVRAEGDKAAAEFKAAERRKRRRVQLALLGAVLGLMVATGFVIAVASLWQRAEGAKQEADNQRRNARQYLYFSRISLASRCWNDAQIQRMDELLAQEREQRPDEDLRGFEWHYLNRIRQAGQFALHGHTDQVNSIAWSPDGKLLASGAKDSTVRLWNGGEPAPAIRVLKGHTTEVSDVAFSPDGKRLASASFDGTVTIWDVASGKEVKTLKNSGIMSSVSWSPDGTKLVASSWNSIARIWNTETWEVILTHEGDVNNGVAFSPDGRLVANPAMSGVEVWDAQTGEKKVTCVGHFGQVFEASWSPDGKQIASAGEDATVRLWDAKTGKEFRTLRGHAGSVWRVRFSPDGQHIASSARDGVVLIWDRQGERVRALRGHSGSVKGLAFSPDGKRLASGSFDKSVLIWDINTDQDSLVLRAKDANSWVWGVAVSPDSRYVASAGSRNDASTVWEVASGRERFTLRGHKRNLFCVAFSPDGKRLATGSGDRTVKIWNMETGTEECSLSGHGRGIYSVAFSPDGKYLVSATSIHWFAPAAARAIPAEIKVWRVEDWQEVASLTGHEGGVTSMAFSPDGARLATASYDKTVRIWEMATGQQIVSLPWTESWPSAVAFRPDGAQIAAGSPDGTLHFWDPVTGRQLKQFQAHPEDIMGIAYSPDGTRLATASHDTTVKLWDLALDNEILMLKAHPLPVMRVAFSPDGTRLVSAAQDATIRVWDGTPVTGKNR